MGHMEDELAHIYLLENNDGDSTITLEDNGLITSLL
jgi:hypothetical protein